MYHHEQIKSFIYIPPEPQPNLICKHNICTVMSLGNIHFRTSHTLLWVFSNIHMFHIHLKTNQKKGGGKGGWGRMNCLPSSQNKCESFPRLPLPSVITDYRGKKIESKWPTTKLNDKHYRPYIFLVTSIQYPLTSYNRLTTTMK